MRRLARAGVILLWTLPGAVNPAAAQAPPTPPASQTPPVPAREVLTGHGSIQAVRLGAALHIDGRLDETVYADVPPISDFIQMEPKAGEPATEKTEVWVFFDQHDLYVAMRAWETRPDLAIANEMRRDNNSILLGGDHVGFSLDTFHDGRNAFQFTVNPLGARFDGQSTSERQYNGDWNPVWEFAVGRFAGGWTVEAAIPFKSLRYQPGAAQVWGFNARRYVKWKNEISFLARIPAAFGIGRGSFAASLFPTLTGIDAPPGSKNLEVKPYAVADLTSDRSASPAVVNDPDGHVGLDVKYGVTQSLTADFTYNTDFAQVEADEQQVNLTRFSLFFPEKREFFLENQGTFGFGAATSLANTPVGDTPLLFYSRRIGLNQGLEVPVLGGGRLTGRVGRFSIGAIDIATREAPKAGAVPTNFSVLRLRRDILRRSSVGVMATRRSVAQNGAGSNDAYGVDGTFAFFANLSVNAYWAKTRTPGLRGKDNSYRTQMEYAGDRYGVQLDRLVVGDSFNPEVGFVRRGNIRESVGQFRFSPRPKRIKSVRKFSAIGTYAYVEDGSGVLQTRTADGEFAVELQNSDRFSLGLLGDFERLVRPFAVTPAVTIPVGAYDFAIARVGYVFGQQRPLSGALLVEHGAFYNGERTSLGFSRTRVNLTPRFSLEPSISINWIALPGGSFTTNVLGSRVTYTMRPLMFTSALLQYNSTTHRASANVRLRWEYRPGSELFVVYNEDRDTLAIGLPELQNRAFIVKVNRLFRF